MPNTELTVTNFKQKDVRLFEASLQRFGELADGATNVSINISCFTETNFGLSPSNEKVLLGKLKLEASILTSPAPDNPVQPVIAKVSVSIQAAFVFEADVKIVPDLKASQETLGAVGDRLLPMAMQHLKRISVDANLPLFALPINMTELNESLKPTKK